MSEQDKIIEKIKKLFALSASSNEHEAELAMQRAYELMEKYEISMSTIEREKNIFIKKTMRAGKTQTREQKYIIKILTDHFHVRVILLDFGSARCFFGNQYSLIGRKHNVELAIHVYKFLSYTFKRLWRINSLKLTSKRMKAKRRAKARDSYYFGLYYSIDEKLIEKRKSLQSEGIVLASDTGALDEFLKNFDLDIRSDEISVRDAAAFLQGRNDGKNVEINKPIPSHQQQKLLLGN